MREHVADSTYSARAGERADRSRRASEAELGAWRAFLRAGSAAQAAMEAALAPTGVSQSEYDVLVHVAAARDGVRPTDLAERILLTKSGLTRLLDRLVDRGFIERHPCPTDRRGQLVVLSPAGRHAFRRASPSVVRAIGALLGEHFTPSDIEALRATCDRIAGAAEAMTT